MKRWQAFTAEHQKIDVLSDTQIIVHNSIQLPDHSFCDELLTRNENGTYTAQEINAGRCTIQYDSIRDYLGY